MIVDYRIIGGPEDKLTGRCFITELGFIHRIWDLDNSVIEYYLVLMGMDNHGVWVYRYTGRDE